MTAPVETISNLKIQGFKSIRDQTLDLQPFNVLIGANGSGKSNFIDYFRLLKAMFENTNGRLRHFVVQSGGTDSVLFYGSRVTQRLDASIRLDSLGERTIYNFNLELGAPDDLHFEKEVFEYKLDDDYSGPHALSITGGDWESSVLDEANSEKDTVLRTAARHFRDTLCSMRIYHFHETSAVAGVRKAQDLERDDRLAENASNLAVFLHNLKQDRPSHYRRILSTVQLVAPFIQDFIVEPRATNERFVMLRWVDRSGETFGPHQLSDGTIRAVALIAAMLQPEEMMPSIMLFDEPELGLHPSAANLVASLLQGAAETRQVVVATQSPILIREFSPDNLIVVERREDRSGMGESTFSRLKSGALDAWLEDFDLGELYEKNVTGGYPR